MGIGLAVSRSIVEYHGGQFWAENNKSGGATFNVAFTTLSCERRDGLDPGVRMNQIH
jgi:K+-sensing histidine kinase KdpD